jgi:nucleoside 2-deoxyribosyltransferase
MACPICLSEDATESLHNNFAPAREIRCIRCGDFGISREAAEDASSLKGSDRWRVSAWICEYSPEVVHWEDIEQARAAAVPGLLHRADRMLSALNRLYPRGLQFAPSSVYAKLVGVGWNQDESEARYMLEEVLQKELQYLDERVATTRRITAKGLLHLEGRTETVSAVGFCAMWFSDDVKPLWTSAIEPAIRAAGYEPLRIDTKQHNGKIDDEIMASIRAARFVVADFTGNRGGVYYEAGFAHGLGLPVIFMCQEGDDLHFDIRQYNCIFWKSDQLEVAQSRLKNRILATIGQGPLKVQR